ncbi:MAG TPA: glycosyltransferase family 2 protein, partial [Blastocatellia bacterium]|nr:glycosyltransferase family 2 protein [Blastocatellia bacterium]
LLEALRQKDNRIRVVRFSRNFGSYAALRAGFEYSSGDAVVTISADLQDSPELFKSFVAHWLDGYHIVWGVRAGRDDPWAKKMLAGIFYRLIRRLALPNLPSEGMDCGLFDRKVVAAFCQIPDRNAITFMTIFWMGFRQINVPYHRQRRRFGESKWPFRKRLQSAIDVITAFSLLPIRMSSYLGLVVSLVSFIAAFVVLFNRLVLNRGSSGWPSLMIVILFLGGVQLVMLGMFGEYIWRISLEVRGRPHYIVMQEIGFDEQTERRRLRG